MAFEKERDPQVSEIVEKTVINARKMCGVDTQDRPVQSTKGFVAGHIQRSAMRGAVHPSMLIAVSNAPMEKDDLMAPIATFLSNYV